MLRQFAARSESGEVRLKCNAAVCLSFRAIAGADLRPRAPAADTRSGDIRLALAACWAAVAAYDNESGNSYRVHLTMRGLHGYGYDSAQYLILRLQRLCQVSFGFYN
jgi:hypothetical protein